MAADEYSTGLGRILTNLQALEFSLRVHLSYTDPQASLLPSGIRLQELQVGDVVPENSLTSFETLSQLVTRYNAQLPTEDADCKVDPDVVLLRDALAHGRASSLQLDSDVVLLKFGRPSAGQVTVTYAERLTRDWLNGQIQRLRGEVSKVNEAMERARRRKGASVTRA